MLIVALASALLSCAKNPSADDVSTFWIADVWIVDGTGAAARFGAVRVEGDRITAVEPRVNEARARIVDGRGLVLAPGFIDTHSHHDGGFDDDDFAAAVGQGLTSVVVGQDGGSHFPLGDFFVSIEASPPAVNVASYSGHGTLRGHVLGEDFRRPAAASEIEQMKELLAKDLAAGALGLSSGLEYDPGIYSTTEELIALAQVSADAGGRYISHLRSEDRELDAAIGEIVRIGREARLPVQISHFKLARRGLWEQAGRYLTRLEAARAEGIEITADVYPYEYWQSTMMVLLPERDIEDRKAVTYALEELAPPSGVLFSRFDPDPSIVGRTLEQVAAERGADPVTAYQALLRQIAAEGGEEMIIATSMATNDVEQLLLWRHSNLCSDGAAADRHPRGRGAFPRALRWLVRERKALTLEQAVAKMTGLAASHMGLVDRGVIAPGAFADLVLFDRDRVTDRATPAEPSLANQGIESLWVNGVLVFDQGAVTGNRPGRVLRRASS